ncbi:MAG: PEGA domain-containing protein, partial [Candidatus Nanoarchaeia archaeon]
LGTNRGKLVFESDPPDADIFVDDKFIGKTPHEEYFEQGEKKIRIQKSDYIVFEQNVSVVKDQERKVLAKLSLLPGKLIVKSEPPGAAIYLNGELTKETPAEFANLFPGQYSIRLELPNHDTESREVTVSPGRETELTIPMSTNLGGIDIVANPPGVVVYLDGKKMGVTVPDQNKAISKIFEIRKVPSGKHTITLLHHRAVPKEIKLEVNVEKGKTSRPKPVTMWIADTYVKLKNGREMNGKLRQENEDFIIFEPEPSIHIQYRKDEIDILKKLFVE